MGPTTKRQAQLASARSRKATTSSHRPCSQQPAAGAGNPNQAESTLRAENPYQRPETPKQPETPGPGHPQQLAEGFRAIRFTPKTRKRAEFREAVEALDWSPCHRKSGLFLPFPLEMDVDLDMDEDLPLPSESGSENDDQTSYSPGSTKRRLFGQDNRDRYIR